MGTMEDIRERLTTGTSVRELIGEGFSSSSVYKAQRQLLAKSGPSGAEQGKRAALTPAVRRTAEELLQAAQVENDPEIVELKRELRLVRLEQQLAEAKWPSRSEGHGLLTVEVHRETVRLYHAVMSTLQGMDVNYHATMENGYAT